MKPKYILGPLLAISIAVGMFLGTGLVLGGSPWPPPPTSTPEPPPPPPPGDQSVPMPPPPGVEINKPPIGPDGTPIESIPFAHVTIRGQVVPLPDGALLGTAIGDIYPPGTPPDTPTWSSSITRGKSIVRFRGDELLDWNVAPEDEADFAALKAAFEP